MIIPTGLANAGWYWYHYDALGSVMALSNGGTVVANYSYSVFGETTVTGSGYGNPYK